MLIKIKKSKRIISILLIASIIVGGMMIPSVEAYATCIPHPTKSRIEVKYNTAGDAVDKIIVHFAYYDDAHGDNEALGTKYSNTYNIIFTKNASSASHDTAPVNPSEGWKFFDNTAICSSSGKNVTATITQFDHVDGWTSFTSYGLLEGDFVMEDASVLQQLDSNSTYYALLMCTVPGYLWYTGSYATINLSKYRHSVTFDYNGHGENFVLPAKNGLTVTETAMSTNPDYSDPTIFNDTIKGKIDNWTTIVTNPTASNYDFKGWYTDSTCTSDATFYESITGPTTYYAKWELHNPVEIPTAIESLTYNGAEQTGVASGTGYTLTGDKATDAGNYSAVATLATDYIWSDGTTSNKTINWSIAKATVTSATAEKQAHTGSTLTPNITVKANSLDVTTYDVGSWSGDLTELGTYTANVTGTGNFTGTVQVSFAITHGLSKVNGKEPTFTESGWRDYYQCNYCKKAFENEDGNSEITDLNAWKSEGGNGYLPKKSGPAPTPNPTPVPGPTTSSDSAQSNIPATEPLLKSFSRNKSITRSAENGKEAAKEIGGICFMMQQGPLCNAAFKIATPNGFKEAFTFNFSADTSIRHEINYDRKKGLFVLNIPKAYQKKGRTFRLIGINKNGQTKIFTDSDMNDDTFTTALDVEGYAFSLIYAK